MNTPSPSPRALGSGAAIVLGGLALVIAVLAATAATGQVRGQQPEAEASPRPGSVARIAPPAPVTLPPRPSVVEPAGNGGVMRAAMESSWAGPVNPAERGQVSRKLSQEERLELRQEIQRATEEVYEPYRKSKH
ncbi:hypothetical protein [Pigmentiphaga humi]|uniref:hypothetical protein n=1 Tax=Pigmentiphaga humi TaxID=2478468 RepID=UPI000F528F7C|nr:hypothetical protein [Pigmentiphaga humi]